MVVIGKTYDDEDSLLSETKRMIEDALLINLHIETVENIEINKDLDKFVRYLQNMEMFMSKFN